MGKERDVDSDDCSSDNENADDDAEVVEEEEPSEIDPCEEELVEEESSAEEPSEELDEEDPSEEEPSEEEPDEEDPCNESNAETLRKQKPNEVLCTEGPNGEVSCEEGVDEEDPSEEEPEEGECDTHEEECEELYEEQSEEEPSEHELPSDDDNDMRQSSEVNNVTVPEKLDSLKDSGKRRSRWDAETGSHRTADGVADGAKKKRKSRWSSDDSQSVKLLDVQINMDVVKLKAQLLAITQKLQSSKIVDERPEHERSPSPPPIYNFGIKINSRETRLRAKLLLLRQEIISELIRKDPSYKPPPDYKNASFQKKLYIPIKEYPDYNFIGLILGPRGNTHKRMEKETGAKILLRGRGSKQEGKSTLQNDPAISNDDLHVLVEADSQHSLDAAVAMVEKLLVPVEDGHNVHKLAQLRELAMLNGSLQPEGLSGTAKSPCDVCGNANHSTSGCPLTASVHGANTNLGGVLSPVSAQVLDTRSIAGKQKDEIDETNLFVGYLPQSVDDNKLLELFSPYGKICQSKVLMDRNTGLSKGYGFVKFSDRISATMAVNLMNGHKIEGHSLAVRVADISRAPNNPKTGSSGVHAAANAHSNPGRTYWPGPPGSALLGPKASFVENNGVSAYQNPFVQSSVNNGVSAYQNPFVQSSVYHSAFQQPPPPPTLLSRDLIAPDELANFPGYLNSLDPPSQLYPPSQTMYPSSSQLYFPPKF